MTRLIAYGPLMGMQTDKVLLLKCEVLLILEIYIRKDFTGNVEFFSYHQ